MSEANTKHDDMLFEMLKECKTLPNFLDEVFGFLHRRTDFYHIAKDTNSAVGLPDGLAEKIVKHSFYKWKSSLQQPQILCNDSSVPTAITEVEIVEEAPSALQHIDVKEIPSQSTEYQFAKSESYNGAVFPNYCWSQTIADVDLIVKLPENVSGKDLSVELQSNHISIQMKDGTVLLSGDLCQKCKSNEAIWSIDGRKLEIHLDKCQEMWWNCLIKSEPKIDISKIDCSRPYEDLPEEAQAKIEELQWNQERKRLGLPTSEEMQLQQTLAKAWNAEGSPFSGPFNPSEVQFS